MERYCIGRCKADEFTDSNALGLWDINYIRVVEKVLGDHPIKLANHLSTLGRFNAMVGNTKLDFNFPPTNEDERQRILEAFIARTPKWWQELNWVIFSTECELDILNDVYLSVLDACNHMEKLYLDSWYYENGIEKNIISVVKSSIKNANRKESKQSFIFDIRKVNSTSRRFEIPSLGSGVLWLWLESKEFKNLFAKSENRKEKYDINKIIQILCTAEENGIVYTKDDYIILEKLLGFNTFIKFEDLVLHRLENLKEENELEKDICDQETIRKFVGILLECKGPFSRCQFIMIASKYIFDNPYTTDVNEIKKKIEASIVLLEESIKEYNKVYPLLYNTILEEYMKIYSCRGAKESLEHQINHVIMNHYRKTGYIFELEGQEQDEEQDEEPGKDSSNGNNVSKSKGKNKGKNKSESDNDSENDSKSGIVVIEDPFIYNGKQQITIIQNMMTRYQHLLYQVGEEIKVPLNDNYREIIGYIIDGNYKMYNG